MKKFKVTFTELVQYVTTIEADNEEDAEQVIKSGDYGTPRTFEQTRDLKNIDEISEIK